MTERRPLDVVEEGHWKYDLSDQQRKTISKLCYGIACKFAYSVTQWTF